ncbi:MAG: MerR family transcriptional regulator [Roseiflexaceae bacterium]
MNQELMTIRQLAERAGVTQRTIRYYTDEGLIDAPVDRVRTPRYTERHLLQLLAAARLKASFLPLRVIRARLAGMDDAELNDVIQSAPQPVEEIVANEVVNEMVAAHHVDRVVTGSATYAPTTANSNDTEVRWHRYVIDDGIEIHFRDDRRIDTGELRRIGAILRRKP